MREVYEMVTERKPADPGALERQRARQVRTMRNRKIGVLVLAATLVTAAGITVPRWMLGGTDPIGDQAPIGVVAPGGTSGIKRLDLTTGELTSILDTQSWANPDVSRDGSMIAFDDVPGGGHVQIHVMNVDGSDVRVLTDAPSGAEDPGWSPDGETIAYISFSGLTSGWDIFVVDISTGRSHRLTREPGDASDPAWSPDGSRILFTVGDGTDSVLRTVDVPTGEVTQLTNAGKSAADGSWSPDGGTIVFSLDTLGDRVAGSDEGGHGLWLMDADGSNRRELVSSSATLLRPQFSPDGSRVAYFVEDNGGCCDTYLLDLATGHVSKVAEGVLFPTWLDRDSLVGATL